MDILILGAGPAGMACALELHKAGRTSTVIEKTPDVGGLARTLEFKEGRLVWRTDIGPHRFFSKNQYLYDMIVDLLGTDWMVVNRKTRQFIEGKFYDYPVDAMQALRNVGLVRSMGMMISYASAQVRYKMLRRPQDNFEDYIIANFGRKLGEFNMLNYSEKVWGIPCRELHPDWGKQRIKGLNMISTLKNAIFKTKGPKTLVDSFYYPRHGTGTIYDAMRRKVEAGGTRITTECTASKICHDNGMITSVELSHHGKKTTTTPAHIVSSIPITEFVRLLSPQAPQEVLDALFRLRWRAQVNVFITVDKESVTDDNWIYFPQKEIAFGRMAEMRNFSPDLSPPGKTSLFIEYYVQEGDAIWNMDDKTVFDLTIKQLAQMGFVTVDQVISWHVLRSTHVYPIYDLTYKKNVGIVKDYLKRFKNLQLVGRPGRFQYTNQDHSLEMGILAAKNIVEGLKYDIDKVGVEDEYFEKGELKVQEE